MLKHHQSVPVSHSVCWSWNVCQGWDCSVVQSLLSLSTGRGKDEIPLDPCASLTSSCTFRTESKPEHKVLKQKLLFFPSGVWQKKIIWFKAIRFWLLGLGRDGAQLPRAVGSAPPSRQPLMQDPGNGKGFPAPGWHTATSAQGLLVLPALPLPCPPAATEIQGLG